MKRRDCGYWLLLSTGVLGPSLVTNVAFGQSVASAEAGAVLEEIVVTSQRREEKLSEVPISISAYSQEKLDAQGVRNIDDIARLTPGAD